MGSDFTYDNRVNHQANWQKTGRRVLKRVLVLAAGAYLAFCLLLAGCQRQLMYFPRRLTAERAETFAKNARLERWQDANGEPMGFKRPSPRQPVAGQVLIAYGNGGIATDCARYADAIQGIAALDVFILEYPGYADRPGTPTEKNIYRAADQAFQGLATNLPVYVLGESLGSGVAAYLAGTRPDRVAGVVLLSPFDAAANVAQHRFPWLPARYLLLDRFPSEDYLRHYRGPVAVTLDGRDYVVPEKFGHHLYDGYTGPKKLWRFPKCGHIQIGEPAEKFWSEVLEFWKVPQNGAESR